MAEKYDCGKSGNNFARSPFSSVVEHQSRKLGAVGSNPTGGSKIFCRSWQGSNLRGQSPLDFKSNALTTRPQLLLVYVHQNFMWRCGGLNPGPFTCKANALPLSYIPFIQPAYKIFQHNQEKILEQRHFLVSLQIWFLISIATDVRNAFS